MVPGDRLICAFVEPLAAGDRFTQWPLHITIVPWFRLPDSPDSIARGFREALGSIGPFKAVGGEIATFQSRKNQPVRLLELPPPFTAIEQRVRTYLHKKRAWLVDETTKRHYEFRPHVTFQESAELAQGEAFLVEKIYIVEQKGEYKEVMAEVKL